MSDHRKALEDIARMCSASRIYTRRIQNINEVAMTALGMTANQRHAEHMAVFERVGDKPMKANYLARKAKREEKFGIPDALNDLDEFDNPLDGQMGG